MNSLLYLVFLPFLLVFEPVINYVKFSLGMDCFFNEGLKYISIHLAAKNRQGMTDKKYNVRAHYKNHICYLHVGTSPDGEMIVCWYDDKGLNRKDGPAVESNYNHREWFLDGKRHRVDGPAIEYNDGSKEWYYEGRPISPMELFERLTPEQKEKVIWDLDEWK